VSHRGSSLIYSAFQTPREITFRAHWQW
jgi:hypothetical protein